jgi:hypothetical protein
MYEVLCRNCGQRLEHLGHLDRHLEPSSAVRCRTEAIPPTCSGFKRGESSENHLLVKNYGTYGSVAHGGGQNMSIHSA